MTALPITVMTDDEVSRLGRRPEPGFGALRCERGLLPLLAMDVDARVVGWTASIDVAQTFVNTTSGPIEATYIFPLPDRAAVTSFRMEVGGRVIIGKIDERGRAREQYDEAISAGKRAAITEEERPGVFSLRVGNLMPGEAATVRLTLVGPLPVDDGEVTFQFPLVVAPRYCPGTALGGDQAGLGVTGDTDLVPDASRISPPVRLPGLPNPVRLGLRVAIDDAAARELVSSLHAVRASAGARHAVEVKPGERLDRDFILRWRIDPADATPRATLTCADDADGEGGTFALTVVPPAQATMASKPRDVVFLIDRSGSMQGWKMVAARRAVARIVDSLTSRDRFAVIAFDDALLTPPGHEALVAATDRARFAAVEFLAKVESHGGTEFEPPLRQAIALLADRDPSRERVIVLGTDGQVGNEDQVLRAIVPGLTGIRVFALGIDEAVNAAFLRRLAAAGAGLCEVVESEERLDAVMAKVHRRIGTPVLTELTLGRDGLPGDADDVTPSPLPDVYAGAPVVIYGRYRGKAPTASSVKLGGKALGEAWSEAVTATEGDRAALAPSWARARIRALEDRYAVITDDRIERTIVAISTRFSVLSRFTAFLAVDGEVVNVAGGLQQVVQPVEQPRGWAGAPGGGGGGVLMSPSAPPRMSRMAAPMAMSVGPAAPPMPSAAAPSYSAELQALKDLEAEVLADEAPAPIMAAPPAKAKRSRASTGAPAPSPAPPPSLAESLAAKFIGAAPRASMAARDSGPRGSASGAAPSVEGSYQLQLGALGMELAAQAAGRCDAAAVRVIRMRLGEWVEDLRSVGGAVALIATVEGLIAKITAALAGATPDAAALAAVATELAALAAAGPPPAGKRKSRLAFWK